MNAFGLEALDLRFDRGPIGDARRPVASGKACHEWLEALEAFDVQTIDLDEWIGMIIDAQIERRIRLGRADQQRCGLLAALVAAGGFAGLHCRDHSLGEGPLACGIVDLCGPFDRPYVDTYTPVPFSRRFVRHIAGWYAQKHPDEDFAETFAVWLTPRSAWKKRYAGWPALQKLEYVDRMVRELANRDPPRPLAKALAELPVEEMATSLEDFYRETIPDEQRAISDLVPDGELEDIFTPGPAREGLAPAGTVLAAHAKTLTDKITYWTGIRRSLAKKLVETIVRRSRELELFVDRSREAEQLLDMTVLATTLAMNYLQRGKFDEK